MLILPVLTFSHFKAFFLVKRHSPIPLVEEDMTNTAKFPHVIDKQNTAIDQHKQCARKWKKESFRKLMLVHCLPYPLILCLSSNKLTNKSKDVVSF